MTKLSKDFSREEFKCKCGECDMDTVDSELVDVLQTLRDYFNQKVKIMSGNRCPSHNKRVGGADGSQHLFSKAVDIVVSNTDTSKVYKYLDDTYPYKYGIGLYSTWVHLDVRSIKGRW